MSHGHGHCCCCVEGSVSFSRDPNAGQVHSCIGAGGGYGSWEYTIWQVITQGISCEDLLVATDQQIWYVTEWDSGASTATTETWYRYPYGGDGLTIKLVGRKQTVGTPLGIVMESITFSTATRQLQLMIDPSDSSRLISTMATGGLATCCQITGISADWQILSRRFANGSIPDFEITIAGFTGGMTSANGTYHLEFYSGGPCGTPGYNCDGYQYPAHIFVGDNGNWLLEFGLYKTHANGWAGGGDNMLMTLRVYDLSYTTMQKQLTSTACRDFDSATWSLVPYYWEPPADPVTITSIVEV